MSRVGPVRDVEGGVVDRAFDGEEGDAGGGVHVRRELVVQADTGLRVHRQEEGGQDVQGVAGGAVEGLVHFVEGVAGCAHCSHAFRVAPGKLENYFGRNRHESLILKEINEYCSKACIGVCLSDDAFIDLLR